MIFQLVNLNHRWKFHISIKLISKVMDGNYLSRNNYKHSRLNKNSILTFKTIHHFSILHIPTPKKKSIAILINVDSTETNNVHQYEYFSILLSFHFKIKKKFAIPIPPWYSKEGIVHDQSSSPPISKATTAFTLKTSDF